MSATTPPSAESSSDEPSKEERLRAYLLEKAQDGELYFKSKFIADEVGLSPKEIGALMVKLRDSAREVVVHGRDHLASRTRTGSVTDRRRRPAPPRRHPPACPHTTVAEFIRLSPVSFFDGIDRPGVRSAG